jgi:hypothetical protein
MLKNTRLIPLDAAPRQVDTMREAAGLAETQYS